MNYECITILNKVWETSGESAGRGGEGSASLFEGVKYLRYMFGCKGLT